MNNNFELLQRIGSSMEMDVSRETYDRFILYKDLLKQWNEKINLTAITDDDGIFLKHFADSISIFHLQEAKNSSNVIDVGTGAGFPGLPMKIMKPDIRLTLLDPLNKRLNFLKDVAEKLGLQEIQFIHGRAEDVSRETQYRESYELAVSRAVAVLPTLLEYCLPFVKVDGFFIAMKGPGIEKELELNKNIISDLSGKLVKIEPVQNLDEFEHNLVLVKKIKPIRTLYPRKNALIKKDNERYRAKLNRV